MYPMGWLQLVGSIKLQVSFAKETYERDGILQKRPIILSILLTVATPYLLSQRSDVYSVSSPKKDLYPLLYIRHVEDTYVSSTEMTGKDKASYSVSSPR